MKSSNVAGPHYPGFSASGWRGVGGRIALALDNSMARSGGQSEAMPQSSRFFLALAGRM